MVSEVPSKVSSSGVTSSGLPWQHCPQEGGGEGGQAQGSCAWAEIMLSWGTVFCLPFPLPP